MRKPRLPRIDGAERAKGHATCRQCRQPIARGDWRIRLSSYDEGQFSPLGFIHVGCAELYFETGAIVAPLLHFSAALSDVEREELRVVAGDEFFENPTAVLVGGPEHGLALRRPPRR